MLQLIVYGLIFGSILALGAIGLTLIYGILNFANFAHGDLMALGAYLALFFRVSLALPMWLAFVLAMLCTAVLGVGLDRVWFRPLRQRRARAAIMAISSLGLALILQNLIRMLWGPQVQYYSRTIHFPFTAGGTLLGMSVRLQPIMGWDLLLPIFAATILGGIGSPYGAMAGALIIGLAEELSTPFIPTEYKTAVSLVLLVLVLLVRPRGLFGSWQQ